MAAEDEGAAHPEPHRRQIAADVGSRLERPERGVECADAGPDQAIGDESGPRQHVDDADLERA